MIIEIFIVKTEKPNVQVLEQLKQRLIKMFHGLTIIEKAKGNWIDENNNVIMDRNEIWQIYTDYRGYNKKDFMSIMKQIKIVTKQSVQAVGMNSTLKMFNSEKGRFREEEVYRQMLIKTAIK